MAHFCLQKLHIRPLDYINMDTYERAFIEASIQVRIEEEKAREKELKNPIKSRMRGKRR
jgi:hypothetical protein